MCNRSIYITPVELEAFVRVSVCVCKCEHCVYRIAYICTSIFNMASQLNHTYRHILSARYTENDTNVTDHIHGKTCETNQRSDLL